MTFTTQANEIMREDTGELSLFPVDSGEFPLSHDRTPMISSTSQATGLSRLSTGAVIRCKMLLKVVALYAGLLFAIKAPR